MDFSLIAALVAGFAGTAVMSVMMKMSASMGMTDMPPMELVTGAMLTGDETRAKQVGTFIHWIMLGTVVFGLGYAAVFTAVDDAGVVTGLLVGALHGIVVGLVFMPMMPTMHPRMAADAPIDGTVGTVDGAVQLSAPGVFGARWGSMTPVGLVLGHVVYGIVAALVYRALV